MSTIKCLLSLGLSLILMVSAFAADKVILTDGRELVGEVIAKTDNYVQIKVVTAGVEQIKTIWIGDVAEVIEDAAPPTGPAKPTGEAKTGITEAQSSSASASSNNQVARNANGQPQVLVLPLTGMVGMEFRHEEIEKAANEADRIKEETGIAPIIVLEIESGGGLVLEMDKIHETLKEVKKRHRIVAWVKEAISAACATAIHCDEIYFHTVGNAGAMTMFAGDKAVEGRELEAWLRKAGEWAEMGGRSPFIVRAMVSAPQECSYDIDPVTGEVTFYNTLEGEFELSHGKANLSLSSSQAIHCKFADGIADTNEELAKLLDLDEWVEVQGQFGRKEHSYWLETLERGRRDIPLIQGRMQLVAAGPGDAAVKRGKQIEYLKQLIRWWDRAPNLCEYEMGLPPQEELKRQIEALRRMGGG